MNNNLTQMKRRRNPFLIVMLLLLIAAIIGVSVWYIQKQTVTTPHAAASTTLAFTPVTPPVNNGQQITSAITVDPGNNQVSLVKLVLIYDNTQLQVASDATSITVNNTAFPQVLQAPATNCNGTKCTLTATFSIGSDPTKAITTKTNLGTFNATVIAPSQTLVTVVFDPTTAVYSLAATDQASENVLSSTIPLSFTVGGGGVSPTNPAGFSPTPTEAGLCYMNIAKCVWDNLQTATSYHYKISDKTTGNVIKEGDLSAPQSSVDFPQQPGDTYTCEVSATNACKTDAVATTTNTCPGTPSNTPTPTITPTITMTPTPTPTPLPTATPAPTATPVPAPLTCNQACGTAGTLSSCGNGMACIGGFCRNPSCSTSYSCTCAQPTTPFVPTNPPQYIAAAPTATPRPAAPKMMPTGPGDTFIKIGAIGAALAIVGGLLIFGL